MQYIFFIELIYFFARIKLKVIKVFFIVIKKIKQCIKAYRF
jgi:hypothetical protein